MQLVHAFNAAVGQVVAAYTFDAGPNAVIYTLQPHLDTLLAALLSHFLPQQMPITEFLNDPLRLSAAAQPQYDLSGVLQQAEFSALLAKLGPKKATKAYSIIVSKIGEGAQVISAEVDSVASRL
jgi:diphosphomevalonate decarboxylase